MTWTLDKMIPGSLDSDQGSRVGSHGMWVQGPAGSNTSDVTHTDLTSPSPPAHHYGRFVMMTWRQLDDGVLLVLTWSSLFLASNGRKWKRTESAFSFLNVTLFNAYKRRNTQNKAA